MRLRYFSIIGFSLVLTFSCKKEKELERFDPEEMLEKEKDSVKNLLSLSRALIEKGKYNEAKKNLTIIINNFGTYQEVIEANQLLINLNLELLVKQISNTKSIDSINIWIKNVSDPDIRQLADSRIMDILSNSEDLAQLEDYLESDGYKAHQDLANQRVKELKEKNKEQAYQNALAAKDSEIWKKFIEDYPNHPEKEKIEETIILLEVNEIFAGEYGEIPPAQLLGDKNFKESNMEITNDTRYTLTLRYSGPEIKKIDISPGTKKTVNFKSGEYRVTASVNAAGVRNFAGNESLYGQYSSTYYISSN